MNNMLVLQQIADSLLIMEKIGDLLKMETSMTSSVRAEMESLRLELETLVCFLKGAAEKQETDQGVRDLVAEMGKTLFEVDDILDAFFLDVAYIKPIFKRFCIKLFDDCLGRSSKVNKPTILRDQIRVFNKGLEICGIKKSITEEGVNLSPPNDLQLQLSNRFPVEDSFVGLKDDVEKLVSILVDKEQDQTCSIICIVGMGGLGKTTLAKRVYNDPQVRSRFAGFAWAKVPQNFQTRKVLEDIFLQLVPESEEEIMTFSNIELVQELYEVQLSKKFLIVLDDVWNEDVWKCLNLAFPSYNTASKLVVTTRCRVVADEIADKGIAHRMRTLTKDESWELFLEKAFPGKFASNVLPCQPVNNQLNEEMHEIGTNLLDKCSGLPLAIVLLGKLLGRKHTLKEWQVVHQRIDWYSSAELGSEEFSKIPRVLALNNYHDLPYYLKPCFLFLGLFPKDSEIDSQKLYQLWIGEGLIPSTTEKRQIKMDIAQSYLDELIDRNMVQVQEEKAPTSTRFKTILLHDLMRDLCVSKGKEESFSKVMDLGSANQLKCSDPTTRRLALYFRKNEDRHFVTLKNDNTHPLRSLLLLNCNQRQEYMTLPPALSSLKHLRSLKILHCDGFKFETGKSLKVIGELTRLTYLSLSECFLDEVPSAIGNLINLQTLDLRVQNSTRIPNILWKIKRLRHLYLPCQFCVRRDEKLRLDSLKNLETLENFDTTLCNANDLIKLPNLCHLEVTTEGNLDDLEAIASNLSTKSKCLRQSSLDIRSLNCYSERRNSILRKLFECPSLYNLHIEGRMSYLSQMISPSLTELVLLRTELDEDPMPTLEKFPRLWILDLNNDAFLGRKMVCSASGFPQLTLLKISNLQNLENLSIEKGAMPNLSTLSIERCKRLKVLHDGFNHLRSLQKLKIAKCHLEPGVDGQGKSSEVWNAQTIKSCE